MVFFFERETLRDDVNLPGARNSIFNSEKN